MNLATILWSIFCGLVFTYYMLTFNGFAMLAWGGAFILSLLAVKVMLERESVASDKVRCLFLDTETIEKSGRKDCIRTGLEPSPSDELCEGCSFALYGATIVDSINKQNGLIR